MAMGVPAHGGALRPCSASSPSRLCSSALHPVPGSLRQPLKPFPGPRRLDAHASDFRVCYQSSEWHSALSKLNSVESDWDKERTMLKIKKCTNQILKDAYDGRISLKGTQQKYQLLEGKKYNLGPLQGRIAPKYANYPNVEIRERSASHFVASRHSNLDLDTNHVMDLTRQSESSLSEFVSKKIKPNGSHVSKETIEGQYISSKTAHEQVNAPRKPENVRNFLACMMKFLWLITSRQLRMLFNFLQQRTEDLFMHVIQSLC